MYIDGGTCQWYVISGSRKITKDVKTLNFHNETEFSVDFSKKYISQVRQIQNVIFHQLNEN